MDTSNRDWVRFTDLLRAYVARRVGADQVDDLVGDIRLRLVKHQDQFSKADKPTAWMYRVASNAIADHYRRRDIEQRSLIADNLNDHRSVGEGNMVEDEDHPEPLRELSGCLLPFIENLPARYREAIERVDFDGLSQSEAAQQLGLSVSGLKSRVQRGRKQLKQQFLNCCEIEFAKTAGIADWSPRQGASAGCGTRDEKRDATPP